MSVWDSIVEERIREATARGEFDNLPGKGKPLPPDDCAGVPEDLRLSFKIMKNSGMLPEEMQLNKEIVTLESLLRECLTGDAGNLRRELNDKKLRYRLLMEQRGFYESAAYPDYETKLLDKLT
ncbi:DnaJ family domain-containing protein [Paenibacillus cymbidii]|uniref:DnaJ family domain-containing protein n=1 Tax=Paenibacillus cymbidii TaxID=1639034 RepID=UPI001080D417|nr:DUF1992 domain-containing protein [Paenibacillus cymbidii]